MGLTQKRMAEVTGVSEGMVSGIKQGIGSQEQSPLNELLILTALEITSEGVSAHDAAMIVGAGKDEIARLFDDEESDCWALIVVKPGTEERKVAFAHTPAAVSEIVEDQRYMRCVALHRVVARAIRTSLRAQAARGAA